MTHSRHKDDSHHEQEGKLSQTAFVSPKKIVMAGRVVDLVKMLVTSSLITMQNVVALFMLRERRRSLKIWRRRQRGRPRRNRPLPTCHLAKYGRSRSNGTSVIGCPITCMCE